MATLSTDHLNERLEVESKLQEDEVLCSIEEDRARLRHSLQVLATYLGITDFNTRFPYPT